MIQAVVKALEMAAAMGWEMLWPLVLGFTLSGAVQAVVSHKEMARLLPDDGPASILKATGLGAASSSCSYAAVAIARAVVKTGGDFSAAMAFQVASTNLVLELGLVLLSLMGWRFMAASWLGGLVMIPLLVLALRLLLRRRTRAAAKAQAARDVAGRMEGHAAMDMSVSHDAPLLKRLVSAEGLTAISHFFVMDVVSLWADLLVGLLIAGAVAAWVPPTFWAGLFLAGHPAAAVIAGPFIGPLVAVFTFVCSVGNVPLAAVLWQGGASFGGVVAFIFGDLIVLPILDIYRRYYGLKAAVLLGVALYASMVLAGLAVEGVFAALHLTPERRGHADVMHAAFAWNATTFVNLGVLVLAALLVWRFMRTGGPGMLKMMSEPGEQGHDHRPAPAAG